MKQRSAETIAIGLLARREHSASELRQKLGQHDLDPTEIENCLQKLCEQGLQSDQRFAQNYLRYRSQKGMGPQRIEHELRQKGINAALIQTVMQDSEIDWFALADTVRCKRFGEQGPRDFTERAKQQRFMQYRGFSHEHITESFDLGSHENQR
ncbi:MAG: recombination regulator RecX [Methylophaga sp.]|nr:recombination regulator RecX [Methylophaga sp.]